MIEPRIVIMNSRPPVLLFGIAGTSFFYGTVVDSVF
jgi:hypothetical protein